MLLLLLLALAAALLLGVKHAAAHCLGVRRTVSEGKESQMPQRLWGGMRGGR